MKGEVVYLYAFDVAQEIVTARVQEVLSRKPVPFEVRTDQSFPRDIPLYRPLAIEPPALSTMLNGRPVALMVRIYDVGVVSITMRVAVEVSDLRDLLPYHQPVLADGRKLDAVACELCSAVRNSLKDLTIRPSPSSEPEAYTVFCLTEIAGVDDANAWLERERRAVAGLLSEIDPERLSESQVNETLRIRRSYEKTDLVVIDWDAALVVDRTGYVEDVLYVLELANLQLEELHVMDQTLDRYLDQAYEHLERGRTGMFGLSSRMLAELRRFRIDLTKLADEVTHITKFFGDWYLARVYLGARERFYLDQWRSSVEERLAQLDQLYTVLYTDIHERRMLWLEAAIVVLFVIDLVIIFWK